MQKVNENKYIRKSHQLMLALVLFVIGTFSSPMLAQESEWEIMLPDVLGPIAVDPTDSDVIYVAASAGASGYTDYKSGVPTRWTTDITVVEDQPCEVPGQGTPIINAGCSKAPTAGRTGRSRKRYRKLCLDQFSL